nr:hypothetical protein [Tanacetum cinerariifolium]
MILESVENCPLIWPTVEENGVIGTKKYAELSAAAEKIQVDYDMKATNIILQGTSLTKKERECKLSRGSNVQVVQTIIPNNAAIQTEDLDTYDSYCDDITNAKAVLMSNISNYGSDVISEIPNSETCLNDMENQGVHEM